MPTDEGAIVNLAAATPVEIDTELARILGETYATQDRQDRIVSSLHSLVGDKKVYSWARGERQGVWQFSVAEVINKAYEARYTDERIGREVISFEETVAKIVSLREEAQPLNREYDRRGGWTRAYLVDNDNGHVHSSMSCSTCYISTRFNWVTALSGHDEAEIVDEAGERACTVCYPSAPVDVLKRASRIEGPNQRSAREEREARQVAKAARDADKAAKAISNPDGSPLKGKYDTLKTERSAWIEIAANIFSHRYYGYDANTEVNNRILAALHHKLGTSIDELQAQVEAKVIAKAKREGAI